ncbi:Glycosyl transferase, family 11, partial [Candidatus Magnetomorum sp. HK-1]
LCKSDYQGIITMNDLGISGRLGHQIFYYLGLKQYAKKHNLYIETSDWIGRYLFEGCDEPLISGVYDTIDSKNPMFIRSINDSDPPQKKFNLKNGCFRYSGDEKKFAQNTLQLLPYWRKKLEPFFFHIKKDKKTLITIHIRRGDFLMEGFYVPSNDLYLDWLESIWRNIEKPVLYIASDEVKAVKSDFAKFNPFTSEDFEEKFYFDDFLTDFYIISQSDIAVLGQSSFSRIAAMSNKKSSQFYWANPKTNKIESIDKSQTASFLKCLVV